MFRFGFALTIGRVIIIEGIKVVNFGTGLLLVCISDQSCWDHDLYLLGCVLMFAIHLVR